MAQKSADEIRAFVRVFARALKAARRERDIYRRAHAAMLFHASQEGGRNAIGAHNTALVARIRRLTPQLVSALRPQHEDLARELVELVGLAQRAPANGRQRGRA